MQFYFPDADEAADPCLAGGKGAALAFLVRTGFEVPSWFVVSPGFVWMEEELNAALDRLGDGPYAVRSSGAMEDGAGNSFAGQFESHLNVAAHEVAEKSAPSVTLPVARRFWLTVANAGCRCHRRLRCWSSG